MSEEEYLDAQDEFGEDAFLQGIGAEALKKMLQLLDLPYMAETLRADLVDVSSKFVEENLENFESC